MDRAAPAIAAFAFLILGGSEFIFVWDRMNTVFKFGLDVTLLLAVAGAAALERLLARRPGLARVAWRTAASLAGLAALSTSVLAVWGNVKTRRVETPRGTLDGLAYLKFHRPDEAAAVEWVEKNVVGLPGIAEAYGPAYQEYGRFSANTGLPTIVGWDYHVFQRGKPRPALDKRISDTSSLFSSTESAAGRVLSTYGTRFVVSGKEERDGPSSGAGLRRLPDLLEPAFSRPDVTLYRVRIGPRLGKPGIERSGLASAAQYEPTPGPGAGNLAEPRGLACGPDGRIWVADFGHDRIVRFEAGLRSPVAFGGKGSGKLEFKQPSAIAIDARGRVFVADTWNSRIQVLSPEGDWLAEMAGGLFGPRGVAVDARGRVYVSDTGNGRVVRFSPDGKVETEWGRSGPDKGRLNNPMGIAVESGGMVWVADNGNSRLCRFDPDGRFVSALPVPGWRLEACSEPQIVDDGSGNVWISVPLEGEVWMVNRLGQRGLQVRVSGDSGEPAKVTGLALEPQSRRILAAALDGRLHWLKLRPRGSR